MVRFKDTLATRNVNLYTVSIPIWFDLKSVRLVLLHNILRFNSYMVRFKAVCLYDNSGTWEVSIPIWFDLKHSH